MFKLVLEMTVAHATETQHLETSKKLKTSAAFSSVYKVGQ